VVVALLLMALVNQVALVVAEMPLAQCLLAAQELWVKVTMVVQVAVALHTPAGVGVALAR